MHLSISPGLDEEQQNYFSRCARIRGISHRTLICRLLNAICADQMIGGILDDDAKRVRQLSGEPCVSHFRKTNRKPRGSNPGA